MKISKKISCSACGTSPVNHRLMFVLNFLDETIGKIDFKIFKFTSSQKERELFSFIEKMIYTFFRFIYFVRFSYDIEKAVTGRSKLIWEEAKRRSIPMQQVILLGRPIEFYRAKIDGKMFYFQSLPIPLYLPQDGYDWLDDKFKLFEKLSAANVPVPGAKKISSIKEAKIAFDSLSKPVIIKPKCGSRGRHTTTNINTKEELLNAHALTKEITLWMVMQEHLFGSVYRATLVNNELVGFFRADPPQITGDGIKNINLLISEKNKNRQEKISEISITDDLINFIERQGYGLNSTIPSGTTINLSAKTGRLYGGYTKEMLDEVHPKMHTIFKKAGEIVQGPVVGFDLIIEDPTKDPDNQRWGIIECNSMPFIDLHYFALEGKPINLAKNVWDLWTVNK
jgi:D-alanine-D-alanine ligase-like ATP-grasp enzyme